MIVHLTCPLCEEEFSRDTLTSKDLMCPRCGMEVPNPKDSHSGPSQAGSEGRERREKTSRTVSRDQDDNEDSETSQPALPTAVADDLTPDPVATKSSTPGRRSEQEIVWRQIAIWFTLFAAVIYLLCIFASFLWEYAAIPAILIATLGAGTVTARYLTVVARENGPTALLLNLLVPVYGIAYLRQHFKLGRLWLMDLGCAIALGLAITCFCLNGSSEPRTAGNARPTTSDLYVPPEIFQRLKEPRDSRPTPRPGQGATIPGK